MSDRVRALTGSAGKLFRKAPKWLLILVGILAALILIVFVAAFFIDEPLRRIIEDRMNRQMKGYTVRLAAFHFQPLNLSTTAKGITIVQDAHPKPPVVDFPYVRADVHWREILAGKLVGEIRFVDPKIHINLEQLREEASRKEKATERGWQQAIEEMYPLKLNRFEIINGDVVYIDQDPERPLHLGKIDLTVANVRNIRSRSQTYPSTFTLDATVFGKGQAHVEGRADFLAEPFPGATCRFSLKSVPLQYFRPILARSDLVLKKGEMEGTGRIEYAPKVKTAHIERLTFRNLDLDYISSSKSDTAKKSDKAARAAKKSANKPGLLLRLDEMRIVDSRLGMIKKGTPDFHVFLANTDLVLTNLSNRFEQGPAHGKLSGRFMGSGKTTASATFRAEKDGPDFDLDIRIVDTQLKSMNDILRAYGKFDVVSGFFSFYSELHVKNRQVTGYVKPLFRDVKAYDRRQDKEKNIFRKLYEKLVGGVAKLLENRPREEVAAKAEISGPLKSPETSTWQIVVELVTNAFFKAILPGFEEEVSKKK